MVGHRSSGGSDHTIGIDAAFLRDSLLQGRVTVRTVAVDLQVVDGYGKIAQGKRCHAAGREIELRASLGFRPQHVIGMLMPHRVGDVLFRFAPLQYKYTGIPASRIIRPMTEFAGNVETVVVTMAAHAATKSPVV